MKLLLNFNDFSLRNDVISTVKSLLESKEFEIPGFYSINESVRLSEPAMDVRRHRMILEGLREYAEQELTELFDGESTDPMNRAMMADIMELVETFAKQGHSGFSANYCINLFNKLARYEPLTEILNNESEWMNCAFLDKDSGHLFQNKKCFALFKEGKDGKPYYLDAIVWKESDGMCFTGTVEGISSRQQVKSFPFRPKTFYVNVGENRTVLDRSQLEEVFEYYDNKNDSSSSN